MDLDISGKTALVLGAAGGLGSAIAHTLAAEGVNIALADRNPDALNVVAGQLRGKGVKVVALEWDLADLAAIDRHVADIENEIGPVDILVNNTGGPPPTAVAAQSQEVWHRQFQNMVMSVIAITDRVLPGMRERKFGRIITSASSGVIAPIPNLGLSNALRSTLVGWSKTLSKEVGKDGVTCNVVVPGRIATQRIKFLDEQRAAKQGRSLGEIQAESVNSIALGRYGNPQEYADVVAFLSSARAAYITGSMIRVDGGLLPNI